MNYFKKISKYALNDIEQRFPNQRIIENYDLFDFAKLRKLNSEETMQYTTKLSSLIAFYYPAVSLSNINLNTTLKSEFKLLLEILFNDKNVKSIEDKNLEDYFLKFLRDMVPELGKLYERVVSLPITTVACERCFSKLNIIKNEIRNQLKIETVDSLLRISSLEEKEYNNLNFDEVYKEWDNLRKRNSNFQKL